MVKAEGAKRYKPWEIGKYAWKDSPNSLLAAQPLSNHVQERKKRRKESKRE